MARANRKARRAAAKGKRMRFGDGRVWNPDVDGYLNPIGAPFRLDGSGPPLRFDEYDEDEYDDDGDDDDGDDDGGPSSRGREVVAEPAAAGESVARAGSGRDVQVSIGKLLRLIRLVQDARRPAAKRALSLRQASALFDELEAGLLAELREGGASWGELADGYGVSRQAMAQRAARLSKES